MWDPHPATLLVRSDLSQTCCPGYVSLFHSDCCLLPHKNRPEILLSPFLLQKHQLRSLDHPGTESQLRLPAHDCSDKEPLVLPAHVATRSWSVFVLCIPPPSSRGDSSTAVTVAMTLPAVLDVVTAVRSPRCPEQDAMRGGGDAGSVVLQGCCGPWALPTAPLQGITPSVSPLCLLQMHSPIPGLGRVMVFLAAALASASLAVPKGWEEEGKPLSKPPMQPPHPVPSGRHRPTRIRVYTKHNPVVIGVIWPGPHCSYPLPSTNWDQSFPVPHGGSCVRQDPTASTPLPRTGIQPQAAHLDPQPWHGVARGANTHLRVFMSL